ncbi:MAG: DUF4097 domain-containing protein [Spirochaetales bacterium]|nr:DUF4097 domain-containing protein [Spirochaetales bacterium]
MLKDTRANKLFLIILVILLALGLAWARGAISSGRTVVGDTEAIPFAKGDSLSVSTISHPIVLEIDPGATAVSLEIGSTDRKQLAISRNGSNLSIKVSPKRRIWIFPVFFGSSSSTLVVTAPPDRIKDLSLASVSAKVSVLDPLNLDSVAISSTSSKVSVLDITAGKMISLSSVSGSVEAGDLKSNGTIDVSSTSGRIETESLQAPRITVTSVSGSVDVALPLASPSKVDLSSTSGKVEADLLGADDYTIDAHTTSGSITIGGEKRSTLTKGDGSSTIDLQTISGSISVHP